MRHRLTVRLQDKRARKGRPKSGLFQLLGGLRSRYLSSAAEGLVVCFSERADSVQKLNSSCVLRCPDRTGCLFAPPHTEGLLRDAQEARASY